MSQPTDNPFPAKLYLFDSAGKYDPRQVLTINDEKGLKASMPLVRAHIADGKEVRITDPMDFCIFHAQNGKIVFPRLDDRSEGE